MEEISGTGYQRSGRGDAVVDETTGWRKYISICVYTYGLFQPSSLLFHTFAGLLSIIKGAASIAASRRGRADARETIYIRWIPDQVRNDRGGRRSFRQGRVLYSVGGCWFILVLIASICSSVTLAPRSSAILICFQARSNSFK